MVSKQDIISSVAKWCVSSGGNWLEKWPFWLCERPVSFSSTSFIHDCVQNCSLIACCSHVVGSSISQSSLRSPALHQSACIPCSGTGESSGAGGVTCRGSRGDDQEQEEPRGGKTQTHRGPAQVSGVFSLYALSHWLWPTFTTLLGFHKQENLRCRHHSFGLWCLFGLKWTQFSHWYYYSLCTCVRGSNPTREL